MTQEGINIVKKKVQENIDFILPFTVLDRSRVFKRAQWLCKNDWEVQGDWPAALTKAWADHNGHRAKMKAELKVETDKLLNLYTPVQYHHTAEYSIAAHTKIMEQVVARGEKVGD